MAAEQLKQLPDSFQEIIHITDDIDLLIENRDWDNLEHFSKKRHHLIQDFFSQWDKTLEKDKVFFTLNKINKTILEQLQRIKTIKENDTLKVVQLNRNKKANQLYKSTLNSDYY